MAKNKYFNVGSIMKPFTKTREGQEIPKEEQGNGSVVLSGVGAKELAKQLMKLGDKDKVVLDMNTIDEQLQRLESAPLKPEVIEQKKASLLKRKDFVRFDLTLVIKE